MKIEWKIDALECYPEKNDMKDVVFTAHWRVNGTDGDFSGSAYGSVALQAPDPGSPFAPFDELTQDQVVGWVRGELGAEQVEIIEASVTRSIEDQRNPPMVKPPLPWAS